MATKTYTFSGVTKWAKVRKPDEKYENWQVPLYLDSASWKKFKESGIQIKTYEDDDGQYVVFKRKCSEMDYRVKQHVENGPPKIYLKEGDEYKPWDDGLIGNGSVVTVKVDIYDTRNGKGHRLISVGIDKLVEYDAPAKEDASASLAMPF